MVSKYIMDLNELGDFRADMFTALLSYRNTINIHLLKILFFKDNNLFSNYFDNWVGEITTKIVIIGGLMKRKSFKHIAKADFIRIVYKGFFDDPTLIKVFRDGFMRKVTLLSPFVLKHVVGGKGNIIDEKGINSYIRDNRGGIEKFFEDIGSKIENGDFDIARKFPDKEGEELDSIVKETITPEVKKLIQTHIIGISE